MPATDPNKSITVIAKFKSPQVVGFYFWFRRKGDEWTKFASAEDPSHTSTSNHEYGIGPFAPGTELLFQMRFTGNGDTPYLASVNIQQDGRDLLDPISISGRTDSNGVAVPKDTHIELP